MALYYPKNVSSDQLNTGDRPDYFINCPLTWDRPPVVLVLVIGSGLSAAITPHRCTCEWQRQEASRLRIRVTGALAEPVQMMKLSTDRPNYFINCPLTWDRPPVVLVLVIGSGLSADITPHRCTCEWKRQEASRLRIRVTGALAEPVQMMKLSTDRPDYFINCPLTWDRPPVVLVLVIGSGLSAAITPHRCTCEWQRQEASRLRIRVTGALAEPVQMMKLSTDRPNYFINCPLTWDRPPVVLVLVIGSGLSAIITPNRRMATASLKGRLSVQENPPKLYLNTVIGLTPCRRRRDENEEKLKGNLS
ncbi:hypothetical protein J6590_004762 [Homalodisca vitripennis]|nr:hypothetical protein J6590_004762 [Homalodisca vitripennis]